MGGPVPTDGFSEISTKMPICRFCQGRYLRQLSINMDTPDIPHLSQKPAEQSSAKGHWFSVQNPVSPQLSCVTQTCGLSSLCFTFSNGKMEGGWVSTYSQSWFIFFPLQLIHGSLTCPESQHLVSTGSGPTFICMQPCPL